MQEKVERVTIEGTTYEVNQIKAKVMIPLVARLAANTDELAQIEIVSAAVSRLGEPIDAGELPMATYMQLVPVVMKVNGMGGDEGKS